MERRSARRSQPRKRYTNDPFEGVEELQDARSDSENASPEPQEIDGDDDSTEEFQAGAEDSPEEEDHFSASEDDLADADVAEADDEPADDDLLDVTPSAHRRARPSRTRFTAADFTPTDPKSRTKLITAAGDRTYIRGIDDAAPKSVNKERRRLLYFGSDDRDAKEVERARKKWAHDPTLPSRTPDAKGCGGMHSSFFVDDDARAAAAARWKAWWLNGGGKAAFASRQKLERLDEASAERYLIERERGKTRVLLGPFTNQQLFELPVGGSLHLQKPWPSNSGGVRNGYILNLGAKVQCLDWAPNRTGPEQYLAVAVVNHNRNSESQQQSKESSAFAPKSPHESNVQIWRFRSTEDGTIDREVEPHLHTVLCHEWADAKVLKWCPLPDGFSEDATIGILGGIWYDGAIRLLHIRSDGKDANTTFLRIRSAAFESLPPKTVYTCLTWINSTRFAAGCANGCVAVWDLPRAFNDTPTEMRPTVYSAVSTSYILSIVSCSPSRPNLLLTSSMSGYIAMSDLSRASHGLVSQASTIYSARYRIGPSIVAWHEFAQIAVHVDETHTLRGSSVRRLFTTTGLARYNSGATCLAVSPVHPFILTGTASGEVVSSTPLKRMVDGKAGIWQQVWFAHEWRRPMVHDRSEEAAQRDPTTSPQVNENDGDYDDGLSRILEGFKAERVVLFNDDRNSSNRQEGTAFATIYEEKSLIAALAWNPNAHVGGWAAAGMANGLLRVEDIALG